MSEEINGSSATETASEEPKKKRVIGRPFTKETAKKAQISANRAKKMRREARAKILDTLLNSVDLGQEVVQVIKSKDLNAANVLEKVIKMIGCHFDQSEESVQNVKVDAKAETKSTVSQMVKFVIDPPPNKN